MIMILGSALVAAQDETETPEGAVVGVALRMTFAPIAAEIEQDPDVTDVVGQLISLLFCLHPLAPSPERCAGRRGANRF
jgi:hypothetical protein